MERFEADGTALDSNNDFCTLALMQDNGLEPIIEQLLATPFSLGIQYVLSISQFKPNEFFSLHGAKDYEVHFVPQRKLSWLVLVTVD